MSPALTGPFDNPTPEKAEDVPGDKVAVADNPLL